MAKFNKPDIVIWNYTEQNSQWVDVALPQDYDAVSATPNKITKYKNLRVRNKTFWNLKITIVMVVIGALGFAYNSLASQLAAISDDASERIVQNTALLLTSHI